jgi:sensor c-di-GMP phosphodiesterase-like protein
MTAGSAEHAIIAAVGTMAEAMDLHLVAEGIESDDQRAELSRLGYRFGQGYLFAKPMDADAFIGVLGRTPAEARRTPRP